MRSKIFLLCLSTIILFSSCISKKSKKENSTQIVTINNINFEVPSNYTFFTWKNMPKDIFFERGEFASFTNKHGNTHSYEVVYISSTNLNWYQAAFLAQDAGGYLVSITSEEENNFIFNLISNKKYLWNFPKSKENKTSSIVNYQKSTGLLIGGYKIKKPNKLLSKGAWLSGEEWHYEDFHNKYIYNKGILGKENNIKAYGFIIEYEDVTKA